MARRGSGELACWLRVIALVQRSTSCVTSDVQQFEILLVVDNEATAQALSATLRRAGHRVTASTTTAGTVETLMRRGPFVDVIMTSTRFGSELGDDAVAYGRRFAANARFIALDSGRVDDPALALHERLRTQTGWN